MCPRGDEPIDYTSHRSIHESISVINGNIGIILGDNMEMYKYKDKDDKRDSEDALALDESISDWNKKAKGIDPGRDCPLCILGRKRDGKANSRDKCTNCIIKVHTGNNECKGTPYWDNSRYAPDYYQQEITFLESLRPKKKVEKDIIKVGDEVMIRDFSGASGLNKGKITAPHGLNTALYHIVVEIGSNLPEGDSHKGLFGNDTIVYNSMGNSYIFTREKYLRLVKPKHCPECGKAK